MVTLTLRDVPNDLFESLKADAARNRRSLNQEAIQRLRLGILRRTPEERQRAFERAWELAKRSGVRIDHSDVEALINEGRE
ncbi:MAG: plasmid stability protein [Dehalococcoidia bacterium]